MLYTITRADLAQSEEKLSKVESEGLLILERANVKRSAIILILLTRYNFLEALDKMRLCEAYTDCPGWEAAIEKYYGCRHKYLSLEEFKSKGDLFVLEGGELAVLVWHKGRKEKASGI